MATSDLLKKSTKTLHVETEEAMQSGLLFSDDYSLEDYRKHLAVLAAIHLEAEAGISAISQKEFLHKILKIEDFRSKAIIEDLVSISDNRAIIPQATISIDNELQAIGVFYVLRGSALGGKIISRRLKSHLLRWELPPANFYSLNPQSYFLQWKEFKNSLDSFEFDMQQNTEIVKGAIRTFNAIIRTAEEIYGFSSHQ